MCGNKKECERDGKKENVYVRIGNAKKGEREECMCGSKIEKEKCVEGRREGDYVNVW